MPITQLPPGGFGEAISPEEWAKYVLTHIYFQSVVLLSGATRIDTLYRQVHVPRITADGTADWFAELDVINAGDPVGNELLLSPKKVAAITTLSQEVVADSTPSVIDAVGTAMTRAVALKADAGILNGAGGKEPQGIYSQAGAHVVSPKISITSLIEAAGKVVGVGGQARCAYLNPADHTALMLEKDTMGRPLLTQDYSGPGSSTVYGLVLFVSPAITAGTALVVDPTQIVVAIRQDAEVAVSSDVMFTSDASVARVIARLDCGLHDPRGVVSIASSTTTTAEAKAGRK